MIVGHPDVVDARDVGVIEMGHQVVLAQKAVERVAAFDDVGNLPEDLKHTLLAGFWQLCEVDARRATDGDPPHAVIAAHTNRAEPVRGRRRACCATGLGQNVVLPPAQGLGELLVLEVRPGQNT
jgi:hypothetical protein